MKRAYEAPRVLIKETHLYESVAEQGNCWSKWSTTGRLNITYTDDAKPYIFSKTYSFIPNAENCGNAYITPQSITDIMNDLTSKYTSYDATNPGTTELTEFNAAYKSIMDELTNTQKTANTSDSFTFSFGSGGTTA